MRAKISEKTPGPRRFYATLLCLLLILAMHDSWASPAHAQEKSGKITINFQDVEIASIVKLISQETGKNFIYDERLKGKITIIAPRELTSDEAFDLFTSVLELKGFTIVDTGKAYKIIPAATIKQSSVDVSREDAVRLSDAYVARLITLDHVSAQDVLPVLKPLVSREGYMSGFGDGNSMLVLDTSLNIDKIMKIVRLLDVEPTTYPPEVVYLKNSQAESMARLLKEYGTQGGAGAGAGAPGARGQAPGKSISPVADTRLQALILFGSPEEKAEYKRLIALLDVPPPEISSKINVYYLENANAVEIAKVLEGLIKAAPSKPGEPAVRISSEFTGSIALTPDPDTNSLIIMALPEDYQNLVQVIKKLDRRPKQVFVEAMIVEVSINKALEVGAKWRATATEDGNPVLIGGVGTIDSSAISDIISGMAGFTVGGLANFLDFSVTLADGSTMDISAPGFAALFSLQEFKDVVNVLSTPHILTSDNKEAEITVGENVPFLSKFERSSSTSDQPVLQSIERKDVGVTLRIKPQISEGDYIKLDIYQEISSISTTTQTGGVEASDIITTKRSAKTSVVVRDRQTVVIGGLIQDKKTDNLTKVPFLGDIPILGWLFRFKSKQVQKTNLLVYLTPSIVKDFDDLDRLREESEEKYRGTDQDDNADKDSKEEADKGL